MIFKNFSNIKVIEPRKEKKNKHSLGFLLFFCLFILIDSSAFAIKPPPLVSQRCKTNTKQLQEVFDDTIELYNKDGCTVIIFKQYYCSKIVK